MKSKLIALASTAAATGTGLYLWIVSTAAPVTHGALWWR